jgi:hypothetical protein
VNADGTFSVNGTSIAAPSAAIASGDSPLRAAAPMNFTLMGSISAGRLSAQLSGLKDTFGGTKDVGSGSSTGLFKASALGTSTGNTYMVVGPSGRAVVLTAVGNVVDGATGMVGANGQLTASTQAGAQVAVNLDPQAQVISMVYTPSGASAPISFAGVSDAVVVNCYLSNLSVRSTITGSNSTLIAGFVVAGSTTKSLLVRGVGPTLGSLGVTGALADPTLSLFAGSTATSSNDDWNTGADSGQIATTSVQLGAFALANGSRDAAILPSLGAGAYTAQITGKGTATGIALVELYDAGANEARLVNVSARTMVGTGADVLIAGFVITGNAPKKLLLRAVGPGLARFGVTGVLADPQLELFQGNTRLQQNDNWGGAAALNSTFDQVGAFGLEANSRDAAILVTLPPGSYSVVVSGVNNSTGVALIEVYEIQ